jgi:hypothetical protein
MNSGSRVALFAVGIVALFGLGLALMLRHPEVAPQPAAVAPAPAPVAAAEPPAPPPAVEPAPPAPGSEAELQKLLAGVTRDDNLRRWFEREDLLRTWAIVLDNLAEGSLPRHQLDFLEPAEKFSVIERDGKLFMDPRGHARYDLVAAAISSVDAKAFAKVVRAVHPLLEKAWQALGYPNRSLDARAAQALDQLASAPVLHSEPPLERAGRLYVFADPELEELGAVEKLLLRMGPKNAARVQSKAREIANALGYRQVATHAARPTTAR